MDTFLSQFPASSGSFFSQSVSVAYTQYSESEALRSTSVWLNLGLYKFTIDTDTLTFSTHSANKQHDRYQLVTRRVGDYDLLSTVPCSRPIYNNIKNLNDERAFSSMSTRLSIRATVSASRSLYVADIRTAVLRRNPWRCSESLAI